MVPQPRPVSPAPGNVLRVRVRSPGEEKVPRAKLGPLDEEKLPRGEESPGQGAAAPGGAPASRLQILQTKLWTRRSITPGDPLTSDSLLLIHWTLLSTLGVSVYHSSNKLVLFNASLIVLIRKTHSEGDKGRAVPVASLHLMDRQK